MDTKTLLISFLMLLFSCDLFSLTFDDNLCVEDSIKNQVKKLPSRFIFLENRKPEKDLTNLMLLSGPTYYVDDSLNSIYKKEKVLASIFAFPLPFGFVGSHRVVLGTKPWVPVAYVLTFGGGLGLLPLVDFFVIVFNKDKDKYKNNPSIFMWMR